MERDRLVFTEVRKIRGKPIFMVTSGGYQVIYLCLVVYLTLLASFFLLSASLINMTLYIHAAHFSLEK